MTREDRMMDEAKTFRDQAAQGDVLLVRVDSVPAHARRVDATDGRLILAHSESGHHHAITLATPGAAELWEVEQDRASSPLTAYLRVADEVLLEHHKGGADAHAPIRVGPGIYEVRRAREWNPWTRSERRVTD